MLDIDRIKQKMLTNLIGNNFVYLPEVDSTNTQALKLAKEGAPEGTVVLTSYQNAGKGRLKRNWIANRDENMLVSILIRPEMLIDSVQKITLASAVILIEAIESFFSQMGWQPFTMEVKWPNDLLVHGKKLAGILTESILHGKIVESLIVGFGLNINTPVSEMDDSIKSTATSLIELSGHKMELESFIAHFLNTFERDYFRLDRNNYNGVVEEWKSHCRQFGKMVSLNIHENTVEAYFEDISADGHLIYRLPSGKLGTLVSGDVLAY
jgi:BirA family biotin operon repressor/biotin-[acetyl-CoA-carboxylase] ligase